MNDIQKILQQLADHEKRVQALEAKAQSKKKQTENQKGIESDDLILSIVNKVGECEESQEIQSKILDQRGVEGKILLCFYVSHRYFKNAWLTTGDIERITAELGVKIDVRNATNKIKEIRQYLESGAVRRKGQPTPYRINRKGINRFTEILNEK